MKDQWDGPRGGWAGWSLSALRKVPGGQRLTLKDQVSFGSARWQRNHLAEVGTTVGGPHQLRLLLLHAAQWDAFFLISYCRDVAGIQTCAVT